MKTILTIFTILIGVTILIFITSNKNSRENLVPKNSSNKDEKNLNNFHIKNLTLQGDFNGDNKLDTLKSRLVSKTLNREIDSVICESYDELVFKLSEDFDVYLEIFSKSVNSIKIENNGQVIDLLKLVNLGDINKNNTDEIAFIVNWADWSNLNYCQIYSYCDGEWKEMYAVDAHELGLNWDTLETKSIKSVLEKKGNSWFHYEYVDSLGETIEKALKINGC